MSRFFAPRLDIDEDPVTGSAHCCLGPFWAGKLSKRGLVGDQRSRRGGRVVVDVGATPGRVMLSGTAVTTVRGRIAAPAPDGFA